jgi:hypothetical protein
MRQVLCFINLKTAPGRAAWYGLPAQFQHMNKSFIFLLSLCLSLYLGRAQEAFPTIRLVPEDFVQNSIKQVHWTTNTFAVKWKYTESGTKKMFAFWGQHPGQKVCIQVGNFQTPPFVAPELIDPVTHSDWRADWLKHGSDKFMNLSESDAKAVVSGMRERTLKPGH